MGQGQELQKQQERPYTYGDVFPVSDTEVAQKPVAPKDAAAMQSSESKVLGHTQKGGPAAVMQSAAAKNVESGRLPCDAASDVGVHQGMTVTQSMIDGRRMTTESVGDQVVAQYADPNLNPKTDNLMDQLAALGPEAVTVGEALEASAALSAADKAITQSDAAAIQAAELVALGSNQTPPGGLGSEAHAAASRVACDEEKTTFEHVLRYGDVFPVSEEVAKKPIAPKDAAAMQSAENQVLGENQKGGPASVMQSAATKNVQAGVLPRDAATQVGKDKGMTVTESFDGLGRRIITESIGDQVVARYAEPNPNPKKGVAPPAAMDRDAVTIGEALEASALSAGDKPISQSDAAAIQAAEMRAIGSNKTPPGGLAAEAQSAATRNQMIGGEKKTTVGEVLEDATVKLPDDKPANLQDVEKVIAAELRNNPKQATETGGVAESVAAAARLNQQKYRNGGHY